MLNPIAPRWDRAALITIDMQNDFSLPAGSGFVQGTDRILPRLEELLAAFRRQALPTFHALRLYLEDGSNAERCRQELLQSGRSLARPHTAGARPVDMIQPATVPDRHDELLTGQFLELGAAEWIFYKPRWSAFYRTGLEERLRSLQVETVIVAGCNFPNCPSATLFDATERDFRVVIASDAVSGVTELGLQWCQGIGVFPMTAADVASSILDTE